MKTVLVSGTSGIIGYGILRSLKASGKDLKLIGTTIYEDSAAQGFCHIFELAPLTSDAKYMDWLKALIQKHKVDLIIPGIEADMYKWKEHASEIEKAGAKVLLNNFNLIDLCKDKWLFFQELIQINSPYAIDTSLSSDYSSLSKSFGSPFLLKPRCGHGSKGIIRIENAKDFEKHKQDIGSLLMAQEIVGSDDEEYTASAYCDGKGAYWASMTLKRKLAKEGFTEKAEVVNLKEINEAIAVLCKQFKPNGPTNFQFRKQSGMLKLLEINPRISSSTSIRTAFGYNESAMAVEQFLENKTPVQPIIKQGRAVRYSEDLIFYK